MNKSIMWDGKVIRYATDNFSHMFEVMRRWDGKYECAVLWANRVITTGNGCTRIEAIQKALTGLQATAYKLPFAEYRMADILTGQL